MDLKYKTRNYLKNGVNNKKKKKIRLTSLIKLKIKWQLQVDAIRQKIFFNYLFKKNYHIMSTIYVQLF